MSKKHKKRKNQIAKEISETNYLLAVITASLGNISHTLDLIEYCMKNKDVVFNGKNDV